MADAGERHRRVHAAEDRRPGGGHVPEHSRRAASGQLHIDDGGSRAHARPAALGWRGEHLGQYRRAGTVVGERINQLDVRIGKIVRFGRTRTNVSLDIFNAFNVDTVTTQNNTYASLWRPTAILQARFLKVSAQLEF